MLTYTTDLESVKRNSKCFFPFLAAPFSSPADLLWNQTGSSWYPAIVLILLPGENYGWRLNQLVPSSARSLPAPPFRRPVAPFPSPDEHNVTSLTKVIHWSVRLAFLAAAVFLTLGGPLGEQLAKLAGLQSSVLLRIVPGASPLVALASALSQRRWYLAVAWLAPPLLLLALAVWKGRVFCRWACPAGTLYALPVRLSRNRRLFKTRIGPLLLWIIVFASLAGAPLVLWLDPLSTFNRLSPLLRGTWTAASIVAGVILPLMLLVSFVQPMAWCTHICPLGYFFEFVHAMRTRPRQTINSTRRSILAGLAVGLPLAVLTRHVPATRRLLLADGQNPQLPILPPGAGTPESFAAACTRCYACVDACPAHIIKVPFRADRALGQLFQPEIEFYENQEQPDWGYCPEWCNECSHACPAGALTPLAFQRKHDLQFATAEIIKKACLAWDDNENCTVCQEVCPYQAIELQAGDAGVPVPIIHEHLCRGCGACYNRCPSVKLGKAIAMHGVAEQNPCGGGLRHRHRRRGKQPD